MNKNVQVVTRTGLMIALVVVFQYLSSIVLGTLPQMAKQLITGSLVNMMLALSVSLVGMWPGAAVGVVSSVMATLLGIGPVFPIITPFIAVSNAIYVVILSPGFGRAAASGVKKLTSLAVAAVAKCGFLWVCVPLALRAIPEAKPPQIAMMTLMFSWPQGITALCGGLIALALAPVLRKAISSETH